MDRTKYNKESMKDVDNKTLERSDMGFRAFKNVRGTAPYFEDNKRKLHAMIRQLQAPDLFFTKSACEIQYLELLQSLTEKENNRPMTLQEIEDLKEMSNGQRYSILKKYPVDVVYHIDARFREQIKRLEMSNDLLGMYKFVDYSYRIEFQQRGSAHMHCLLWLEDDEGNSPPSVTFENEANDDDFIKYFDSVITATSTHPDLHGYEENVTKFQCHKHTFSCEKNRKGSICIKRGEGHGRMDGIIDGEELIIPVCRHSFPKFPVLQTTIVRKFLYTEENKNEIRLAEKNLERIKKFIIRQSHTEEKFNDFKKNDFLSFLDKLGLSYDQYMQALKIAVKGNVMILPKRDCSDVFTNNFNKKILIQDTSNHDLQVILNKQEGIAAATYIAKYITKEESGQSNLLKSVEEQTAKDGDSPDVRLKKLAKVLDDTREVGLQEIVYRLLGFSMCKSSRKHKFINTSHPAKRDGLLKPNIESLGDNESVFYFNIIDYYQKRALTTHMENMCLAEFVSEYDIYDRSNKAVVISDELVDEDNIENPAENDNITDNCFNNDLILQDNLGKLKKRQKRAIIRYCTGKRMYENEDYIKSIMLLFFPFRNEITDVHENPDIMHKYLVNQDVVVEKQADFDPYPNFIEELEQANAQSQDDFEGLEVEEEETTTAEEINDFMHKQSKIHDGSKIRLEELKTMTE